MSKPRRRSNRGRDRRLEVARMRSELLRSQSPRLQMLVILVLTGGFGFLASWGLLQAGVSALWLRYPVAVALAYGFFLVLLRLWLGYQRRQGRRDRSVDLSNLLDVPVGDLGGAAGRGAAEAGRFAGAGGRFGGGGASEVVQGPLPLPLAQPPAVGLPASGSGPSSAVKDVGGAVFDLAAADETTVPLAVVLAVLAAAFSLVLASGYLVWTAPVLFAEVLVDGLVVAALSHRLRRIEGPSWIGGVARRTWLPAAGTAAALGLAGYLLQRLDPEIDSIGDIFRLFGLG